MNADLPSLMHKYEQIGISKGSILLLEPHVAIEYADELRRIGVVILGVELWYFMDFRGERVIVEDPAAPFFDDLLDLDDPAARTAEAAQEYIRDHLPERIALVSFVLDDPYYISHQPQGPRKAP